MENQRDSKKKGLSCLSWLQDAGMESRDQKGLPADSRKEMGPKPTSTGNGVPLTTWKSLEADFP